MLPTEARDMLSQDPELQKTAGYFLLLNHLYVSTLRATPEEEKQIRAGLKQLAQDTQERELAKKIIDGSIDQLVPRYQEVIRLRYGLVGDSGPQTLSAVGAQMKKTATEVRARQILVVAERDLIGKIRRHPDYRESLLAQLKPVAYIPGISDPQLAP